MKRLNIVLLILVASSFIFVSKGFAQEYQVFKLEKHISEEEFTEYAPTLSLDGQYLVFQSDNNRFKTWQLFEAESKGNGKWSKPKAIESINEFGQVPGLENKYQGDFIAGPQFSGDGQSLYFYATFNRQNGRDIFYVKRGKKTWKNPVPIGHPINTENHEDSPSIAADGNRLFFMRPISQKTPNGEPCYQIWQSKKGKSGNWQEPQLLPSPINTGCEKAPRIMADNVTLIFSSVRAGGAGDYDLYVTVEDIKGNWSEPRALEFINTPAFEQFVSIPLSEEYLIFNRMGETSPDIYQAQPLPPYLKLVKYSNFFVQVLDSLTQKPIRANIKQVLEDGYFLDSLNCDRSGKQKVKLRHQYAYVFEFKMEGYLTQQIQIDLTQTTDTAQINQQIMLVPIPKEPVLALSEEEYRENLNQVLEDGNTLGVYTNPNTGENIAFNNLDSLESYISSINTTNQKNDTSTIDYYQEVLKKLDAENLTNKNFLPIQLPALTFDKNDYQLSNEAKASLSYLKTLLESQSDYQLVILAHTDDVDTEAFNQNLSDLRAENVYHFLASQEIDKNRLYATGLGETAPLLPNTSEENKARNRRVELLIVFE